MEKMNGAITIESKPAIRSMAIMARPTDYAKSPNDQVRIVGIEECKAAAQCLTEAFMDDDVARYFVHTEPDGFRGWTQETKELHASICEYTVYAHILKGLVTTTGPNYDCIALWMPPGQNMDDWFTMFKSGMWKLRYQLSTEGRQRFFKEFLPLLHDTKAAALGADDDNSWYLVWLGTKPSARGKGYGTALIEMVTKHADAEGLKCYLESSHRGNLEYYRKRGFEIDRYIPKIKLIRDQSKAPIEMDIMVRQPDPSKLESHTASSRNLERRNAAKQRS